MKLILLFAILDIVLCIQFGTNVLDIKQYPFYIMIGNPHICGGTLLSYDPPLVLTAAHCVADAEFHPSDHTRKNPYFVNYNDVRRDKQRSVSIIDWTVHPLYNVSSTINMNYDVAIVRLATPLKKSTKVNRVPLWSPSMKVSPTRGELIGFGYTGLDESEAPTLKRLQLDITRFNPNTSSNVEARSDREQNIACHGDSGSPLVVYQTMLNPTTNKNDTVPFVVGNLARIFGAHDASPTKLTCPIPHQNNRPGIQNTVVESFCNLSNMLDWIAQVTGIPKESLSDPFYLPPCQDNCNQTPRDDDDKQGNLENLEWHIGVITPEFLDTQNSHLWIGGMNQDSFILRSNPITSNSLSLFHHIHTSFVLLFIILFIVLHYY